MVPVNQVAINKDTPFGVAPILSAGIERMSIHCAPLCHAEFTMNFKRRLIGQFKPNSWPPSPKIASLRKRIQFSREQSERKINRPKPSSHPPGS
jgi:hypothetical protein